jgi:hypothetical protein
MVGTLPAVMFTKQTEDGIFQIATGEVIAWEKSGAEGRQGQGARPHPQGARPVSGSLQACFLERVSHRVFIPKNIYLAQKRQIKSVGL